MSTDSVFDVPYYLVDAFADGPFTGNPAAVFILDAPLPTEWLQAVATEMNLSDTAFVWPTANHPRIRWFTPIIEGELCGHATIAAAHVLWNTGRWPDGSAIPFECVSGLLLASPSSGRVVLSLQARKFEPLPLPPELSTDLIVTNLVSSGWDAKDFLVELRSPEAVLSYRPDYAAISVLPSRGLIITAAGNSPVDFVVRFFAPKVGIAEDPAAGSIFGCLTPYWCNRLGRSRLAARFLSSRGGIIWTHMLGDLVEIAGDAVVQAHGMFRSRQPPEPAHADPVLCLPHP
jgi:PhzF family phenazine biosynthesis protein